MELAGKHTVVTGGASGIGRALCQRFAAEDAAVVVADVTEAGAQATADGITDAGGARGPSPATCATSNRSGIS